MSHTMNYDCAGVYVSSCTNLFHPEEFRLSYHGLFGVLLSKSYIGIVPVLTAPIPHTNCGVWFVKEPPMSMQTTYRIYRNHVLLASACHFAFVACAIELPDANTIEPASENQLSGIRLVQTAKLVRTSCYAICDAYSTCGLATEGCRETCQAQESQFIQTRSIACAEAMSASYECVEAALCPEDKLTFIQDMHLCELAHDDHIRDVCENAPPAADDKPDRDVDNATKEVCSNYCNARSECGIISAHRDADVCVADCIDSVIAMDSASSDICGNKLIDSLSCAQSLNCGELKYFSAAIWDGGSDSDVTKCGDSLTDIAICTTALAQDVPVHDVRVPAPSEDMVTLRSIASCDSLCRLSEVCQLDLASNAHSCRSECAADLDDTTTNAPASAECIDARVDLQFCLARLTCGEFSEWLTTEMSEDPSTQCSAELDRISTCI